MKNRNALSLLSIVILCALAFTTIAQGFDVEEARRQAEENTRRANEHCPGDDMAAAILAYMDAADAVDAAEEALAAAEASGSTWQVFQATLSLAIAQASATTLYNAAVAAVEARRACLESIGIVNRL